MKSNQPVKVWSHQQLVSHEEAEINVLAGSLCWI